MKIAYYKIYREWPGHEATLQASFTDQAAVRDYLLNTANCYSVPVYTRTAK
jgi:hypothetical protein